MIRSNYLLCSTDEQMFNELIAFCCTICGTHEEFVIHWMDFTDLDDELKELIQTKQLWQVE